MKSLSELSAALARPPLEYSPVPLWFLNGDMNHRELERQLRLMRAAGIGGVVLHARQGRTCEYMSAEWMDGIECCVETCAEVGMKAWLYDEDNFPSGYAGGEVLRRYPEGRAKCLAMVDGAFVQQLTPWHPAYSSDWYTDLLDPRVTEVFIEATHERCAEVLGAHLGTTVAAVFTDEPGFYNHFYDCAPGTVPWTPDLPEEFERRRGYDLVPRLKDLFEGEGETCRRTRRDFYRVVSRLIVERFYLPQKKWCNERGMKLVGHVNNEEHLVDHVRLNADYFSAMDGFDMPGLDIIFVKGDYRRAPDSIVPKLASSAAHTRGRAEVLTETYGAMGWDLAPEEMRRLADWQLVRGVTRFAPHALFYSIEGERYNECPPSLFWQSPHWPYIVALFEYIKRWTWVLENSLPVAEVAVYYPIDAVREVTSPQVPPSMPGGIDEEASEAGRLGKAFREVMDGLFRAKVDFDVVDDVALTGAEMGEGEMRIAGLGYRCLILPPGEPSEEAAEVIARAKEAGVEVVGGEAVAVVARAGKWAIARLEPAAAQVTVARRRTATGEVVMVVNEGEEKYEGTLVLPVEGKLTRWDMACGHVEEWAAEVGGGEMRIALRLLAGGAEAFGVET
jgi:hypothetical protein